MITFIELELVICKLRSFTLVGDERLYFDVIQNRGYWCHTQRRPNQLEVMSVPQYGDRGFLRVTVEGGRL